MCYKRFRNSFLAFAFAHLMLIANASGSVLNGGFETGSFSGWSTIGEAIVPGAALGSGPASGSFNALITTGAGTFGDPTLAAVSTASLESFLGIPLGAVNDLIATTSPFAVSAFEGSAIKQTVTVLAGDTMSFDVNFLTNEFTPEDFYIDTAFVTFDEIGVLFNTDSPLFVSSGTSFFDVETGFAHFSHTFTSGGTHTLGFGVVDVGDGIFDSGLLIDNVQVVSGGQQVQVSQVSEPSMLALFGIGAMCLGFLRRQGSGA